MNRLAWERHGWLQPVVCAGDARADNREKRIMACRPDEEEKMSEKLKPCPFCGKTPQTVVDDATEEKFGVKCFSCGGMIDTEKYTLQEAIEAWNRRARDEWR